MSEIISRPTTKEYREGWERIYGKRPRWTKDEWRVYYNDNLTHRIFNKEWYDKAPAESQGES